MFPEVEILALAADLELKLQLIDGQWRLASKFTPDGTTREVNLTERQASAVMALFVGGFDDDSSGLVERLYAEIGEHSGPDGTWTRDNGVFADWSSAHRPIP
jgi:hypothetical protein